MLGLTFKENVPDILTELKTFGLKPVAHDPLAAPADVSQEYGLEISQLPQFKKLDALILAVPHRQYLEKPEKLNTMLRDGGILVDIKSAIDPKTIQGNLRYWSL